MHINKLKSAIVPNTPIIAPIIIPILVLLLFKLLELAVQHVVTPQSQVLLLHAQLQTVVVFINVMLEHPEFVPFDNALLFDKLEFFFYNNCRNIVGEDRCIRCCRII